MSVFPVHQAGDVLGVGSRVQLLVNLVACLLWSFYSATVCVCVCHLRECVSI